MIYYLLRRLLLLPITLFAIILVNFVIINLAPGDPSTLAQLSTTGEATRTEGSQNIAKSEYYYLQFREHYGLTLPILWNVWPNISFTQLLEGIDQLVTHRYQDGEELTVQDYHDLRTLWGDRARFIMPLLLKVANDSKQSFAVRQTAANLFIRGGTHQGYVGPNLSAEEKQTNKKISEDNNFLSNQRVETPQDLSLKLANLQKWYDENVIVYNLLPNFWQKVKIFFIDTRFFQYLGKVLTLDFGTLRNDNNKTVIDEVVKRFKYSLTLSLIPLIITFVFCQLFGIMMAVYHNRLPDLVLNVCFLILYAIPIFVAAPFLIEKIALHHYVPFTNIPIPISGFTSPESIFNNMTSSQKLFDISIHIFLPIVAIIYGTLAIQSRLSRTAALEVLRQDYVRTARAKGLPQWVILLKHVGRNASITIVTSLAASLGVVLGGSLIVETLFGINGFGRFFYEAIVNRDYNVILFSAFAGSFLTLIGYLMADIAYTTLDPRVNLE